MLTWKWLKYDADDNDNEGEEEGEASERFTCFSCPRQRTEQRWHWQALLHGIWLVVRPVEPSPSPHHPFWHRCHPQEWLSPESNLQRKMHKLTTLSPREPINGVWVGVNWSRVHINEFPIKTWDWLLIWDNVAILVSLRGMYWHNMLPLKEDLAKAACQLTEGVSMVLWNGRSSSHTPPLSCQLKDVDAAFAVLTCVVPSSDKGINAMPHKLVTLCGMWRDLQQKQKQRIVCSYRLQCVPTFASL